MTGQQQPRENDLMRRVRAMEERGKTRSRERAGKPEEKRSAADADEQLYLPITPWPNAMRAIPNDLARSALFSIGHGQRAYLEDQVIASLGQNVRLTYTGEQLYQSDEDFFCQLFHLARGQSLGEPVIFSAHGMLKTLGWAINSAGYKRLDKTITRARQATIREVTQHEEGQEVYIGGIISHAEVDTRPGLGNVSPWVVHLDERTRPLFEEGRYSYIDWEQRQQLRNVLAKWLHSFFSTHRQPFPMKVATFHTLCGSTSRHLRRFRQTLRTSLIELQRVSFLADWEIDSRDRVHVEKL